MSFHATFSASPEFAVAFSGRSGFEAEFDSTIEIPIADFYPGPYEVTPTTEEQILPVAGLAGARDITVRAIPSNYGLVTWNGSTLTVS